MSRNYAPAFTAKQVSCDDSLITYSLRKVHKDCNDVAILIVRINGETYASRPHYYKPENFAGYFLDIKMHHAAELPESALKKIDSIINELKIYRND